MCLEPTWPVADTCFPIQNLKPEMYLGPGRFQVPFYPPKTLGATYTWDMAGRRYQFSHLKPEARDVFMTWPVSGTFLPTQTMRRDVYLWPGRSQRRVPATGACFPTQNMKCSMYLRLSRCILILNAATGVLATGVLAAGNLLFNTSLAIFVFSLPKIVMWEQQLAWRQIDIP